MYKYDRFLLQQLQAIFYRLKPGIAACCDTYTVLIKPCINNFLSHIRVFMRQH